MAVLTRSPTRRSCICRERPSSSSTVVIGEKHYEDGKQQRYKMKVSTVQQKKKVRDGYTKDSPPKTNPSSQHRFINIYHGQELTSCVFPPILQNPSPQQCNRTLKSESPWHKGQSSQNKPFSQPQFHKHIPWTSTHPLCVSPHFAKSTSKTVQQKKKVSTVQQNKKAEVMTQRTVLPNQTLPPTTDP